MRAYGVRAVCTGTCTPPSAYELNVIRTWDLQTRRGLIRSFQGRHVIIVVIITVIIVVGAGIAETGVGVGDDVRAGTRATGGEVWTRCGVGDRDVEIAVGAALHGDDIIHVVESGHHDPRGRVDDKPRVWQQGLVT